MQDVVHTADRSVSGLHHGFQCIAERGGQEIAPLGGQTVPAPELLHTGLCRVGVHQSWSSPAQVRVLWLDCSLNASHRQSSA